MNGKKRDADTGISSPEKAFYEKTRDRVDESYLIAKEFWGLQDPSHEQREQYWDYLLEDEKNWDGVERLFYETVQPEAEPSLDTYTSFYKFLKRNSEFRTGWVKSAREKITVEQN